METSKKSISNKSESKPIDIVLNRLKQISNYNNLSQDEVNYITSAFIKGFFIPKNCLIGNVTFIRPKSEKLNLEKYTDSDIVFWCCRILEKPLVTIVIKK